MSARAEEFSCYGSAVRWHYIISKQTAWLERNDVKSAFVWVKGAEERSSRAMYIYSCLYYKHIDSIYEADVIYIERT